MPFKVYNDIERKEYSCEILEPNGTIVARVYQNIPKYQLVSLAFSQTTPLPTFGGFTPEESYPHSVDMTPRIDKDGGNDLRTADGYPVYISVQLVGTEYAIKPEDWANTVLTTNEDLSQWCSRHTKREIEDLAQEKEIDLTLYINRADSSTTVETITLHWENKSKHIINYKIAWIPAGSDRTSIYQNVGYRQIVGDYARKVAKEESYTAETNNNDGAIYKTWGDLDSLCFYPLTPTERLLVNRLSTNYNSADYYHFCLLPTYNFLEGETGTTFANERILCCIPKKVETVSDITYNKSYFETDGANGNLTINFNIVLDGEIPSEVEDDGNLTRNTSDDSHDNDDSGKNDTSTTNVSDGNGTDTTGLLTTTYSLTAEQCRILGQKLWSQSYLNVLKIQTDPIQNIVSCKAFPFSIDGESANIKIGDVSMDCTAKKVEKNSKIISVGSITVPKYFNNFLDYAPFTQIEVFIPYCGIHQLDCSLVMGQTLSFDYIVDLVTGASRCRCKIGTTIISEWDCTMGIDIPLSSTDRAQTDAKHLTSIATGIGVGAMAGGVVGAIGGGISGVINGVGDGYHSSKTSGGSPTVSSNDNNAIFLIINRPSPINSSGYNHAYGKLCKLNLPLSTLGGYTEVGEIDLTGIPLTLEEENELLTILKGGFYA